MKNTKKSSELKRVKNSVKMLTKYLSNSENPLPKKINLNNE